MAQDKETARAALMAALMRLSRRPGGPALTAFCREAVELLGVVAVRLELLASDPDEPPSEYQWPSTATGSVRRPGRSEQRVPVLLAGEPIGSLILHAGSPAAARAALAEVSSGVVALLAPVLQLARMESDRQAEIARARYLAERIAVERRAALAERDLERRELERDLHDGAQHHLLALQMSVGLLDVHLETGNLAGARAALGRLRSGTDQAERSLLEMAAGNCPPILIEQGIPAALAAELAGTPDGGSIVIRAEGRPGRFSLVAETAVFFTCLEAVSNARKHAPGAALSIDLRNGADGLGFRIVDEGPGLARRTGDDSFGLDNMRARVEAVGGQLEVRTGLGAGTTVEGYIPA
jgi:signal transduction histidine kinase